MNLKGKKEKEKKGNGWIPVLARYEDDKKDYISSTTRLRARARVSKSKSESESERVYQREMNGGTEGLKNLLRE